MSEQENNFTENNTPKTDTEETSTVFSAPAAHDDGKIKKKNPKKLIAILLTVCIVLGAGAAAAVILIPKSEEEEKSLEFALTEYERPDVESISLKNEKESFVFECEVASKVADTDYDQDELAETWSISDVSKNLVDSSTIASSVYYYLHLNAIRKVEGTDADYGLDKPRIEYTVKARDNKFKTYTVYVGNKSYDGIGSYVKLSDREGIFLVPDTYIGEFEKVRTDYASTTAVEAAVKTTLTSKYFGDDDKLATCDKIILSGRHFAPAVTFEPNDTEATQTYSSYVITSPVRRYAKDTNELLSVASSGVVGQGAYVFNPDAETLKDYGFDDPLGRVQVLYGGIECDVKICEPKEKGDFGKYYAVTDSTNRAIYKVSVDSLTFMSKTVPDYYNTFLTMEMLQNLSDYNVTIGNTAYNFSVKYDENADEGKDFKIVLNGKDGITQSYFQNFYSYFISIQVVEYGDGSYTVSKPDLSVVMKHTDKKVKDTTLELFKITDQRYLVKVDGYDMGLITSSAYKKLVKYTEAVAANTDLS